MYVGVVAYTTHSSKVTGLAKLIDVNDAMRYKRGLSVAGVCLSLRSSIRHVRVHCIQTAEGIVKHLSRPGSSIILVTLTSMPNSKRNPFSRALNTRVVEKFCNFRLKSSFILETV